LDEQVVLIIDDEPTILMILEEVVGRLGCRIIKAEDGKKALSVIKEQRPDLIISDIMMPGMDGYQLHEALQKDDSLSAIPLIFLTARAIHQEKLKALEKGVEDYW